MVPAEPSMQVTLHAVAAHMTVQLPWHLMSQEEPASQVTVLLPPRSNLQDAVSWQVNVAGPVVIALHLAAVLHVRAHPAASHVALQSAPALQVQEGPVHAQ